MRFTIAAAVLMWAVAAHADWTMDRLMISAWGGPETDEQAAAYVDAGLNTVMVKAASLDVCRRAGLRAIVFDGSPEMAAEHKDDPAVWGWYVRDEPTAELFEEMGRLVAPYHAADPNHPAYVNLMAWMPLDQYFEKVKPRFLSYDYYQWWWGSGNYCGRLEAHRTAALKAGVPLICWIESNADGRYEWGKPGAGYLEDNAIRLRQSVYLALAYGVTGIQWFTAGLILRPDAEGKLALTESGRDIRAINRELVALGPTLLGLRSTAVGHTSPQPGGTTPVPEGSWLSLRGSHGTLGLFDDQAGARYAMLVNRHLRWARPFALGLGDGVHGLERFERVTGVWEALPTVRGLDGRPTVRLDLDPGDGVLLRATP